MGLPISAGDHSDKLTKFDDRDDGEVKKNKVTVGQIVSEHLQTVLQSFKNYKNLQQVYDSLEEGDVQDGTLR